MKFRYRDFPVLYQRLIQLIILHWHVSNETLSKLFKRIRARDNFGIIKSLWRPNLNFQNLLIVVIV